MGAEFKKARDTFTADPEVEFLLVDWADKKFHRMVDLFNFNSEDIAKYPSYFYMELPPPPFGEDGKLDKQKAMEMGPRKFAPESQNDFTAEAIKKFVEECQAGKHESEMIKPPTRKPKSEL